MARLVLIGDMTQVELAADPEDGQIVARCFEHSQSDARLTPPGDCSWTERYDDLGDASEYAADHADRGVTS